MNGQRGFSLIELLVAMAVMLAVLASTAAAVHHGLVRTPWLEEAADLQQRVRVAAESMAADIRAAGAGGMSGPIALRIPPVLPRDPGQGPTLVSPSTLTVRFAADDNAEATLAAALLPGDMSASLQPGATCVVNAFACGFVGGAAALVTDGVEFADLLTVTGVASGALAVADLLGPRTNSYSPGSRLTELTQVTYSFDPAARVLKRQHGASAVPMVDNLTQLAFSYLGVIDRPSEPRPPSGVANCLYEADGTPKFPSMTGSPELVPIPLADLADGPYCGIGPLQFDVDLLRIRAVRVEMRLDTGADLLRGTDPKYFSRPGLARSERVIPDVVSAFTVSLRNAGR